MKNFLSILFVLLAAVVYLGFRLEKAESTVAELRAEVQLKTAALAEKEALIQTRDKAIDFKDKMLDVFHGLSKEYLEKWQKSESDCRKLESFIRQLRRMVELQIEREEEEVKEKDSGWMRQKPDATDLMEAE